MYFSLFVCLLFFVVRLHNALSKIHKKMRNVVLARSFLFEADKLCVETFKMIRVFIFRMIVVNEWAC